MTDLTYCEKCFVNFEDDSFDYRFDFPVCFQCVEDLELEPEEEDSFSDDFPLYLEYDEGQIILMQFPT